MTKLGKTVKKFGSACLVLSVLLFALDLRAESGDFSGYEIRVIRPRFMTKRLRLELGSQLGLIMNQSFIYTFLASGIVDFHLSEMFALEVSGAKGISIDKEDKRILEDQFDIKTSLLRTDYLVTGGLLWTPMYGKTQLPSGQVIYFDNFLSVQGGLTGVFYDYKRCEQNKGISGNNVVASRAPRTVSYPAINLGFGQKFFATRSFSIRWDVRSNVFFYNEADGDCDPEAAQGKTLNQNNINLQFGASTFF